MHAYKVPEKLKDGVEEQIQSMLKQDIIEPSQSPIASPLVCILKGKEGKDGIRLAVDYRYVNRCSCVMLISAVVYDKDADFGRIKVIEPIPSESKDIANTAEQLPSQKITPESLAHLSKIKQKQLLAVLDKYPECFSEIPGYTEEAKHTIPLMPGFVPKPCMHTKYPRN